MKKTLIALFVLLTLTACDTGKIDEPDIMPETETTSNTVMTSETTTEATTLTTPDTIELPLADIFGGLTTVYYMDTSDNAGKGYEPALALNEDGTFIFLGNFYSSVSKFYGKYDIEDTKITCNIEENEFGDAAELVLDFLVDGDMLVYTGDTFGTVYTDTVFYRQTEIPYSLERNYVINNKMTFAEAVEFLGQNLAFDMTVTGIERLVSIPAVTVYSALDGREMKRFDILADDSYAFEDDRDNVDLDGLRNQEVAIILFATFNDDSGLNSFWYHYCGDDGIYCTQASAESHEPITNKIA